MEQGIIELALDRLGVPVGAKGALVLSDASVHIHALEVLVQEYLADPGNPGDVDWDFLATRNMQSRELWKDEDANRHQRALETLSQSGYKLT